MHEISVIVPIYNVDKYIHKCVDSILAQIFNDFELILIDDGSTDTSGNICDEYVLKDERIKVIHQANKGVSAARNTGLDVAEGKYISFIDSDDFVSEYYLRTLYKGLIDNDCDIATCKYIVYCEGCSSSFNLDRHDYMCLNGRDAAIELYSGSNLISMTPWGKLFRKALFKDIHFPIGKIHEDNATVPILLYKSEKICAFKCKLYGYTTRENSIMNEYFSIKRYDAIDATDLCVDFFKQKKDYTLVDKAMTHRILLLYLLSIDAKKAGIYYSRVPKKYRISEIKALLYLQKHLPYQYFTYQLSKVHPNWVLTYEYIRKIMQLIRYKRNEY